MGLMIKAEVVGLNQTSKSDKLGGCLGPIVELQGVDSDQVWNLGTRNLKSCTV